MTNTSRHYYATVHTHDVRFCNDHGTLWRFGSKEERDEFVGNRRHAEAADGSLRTETVTYEMARKLYPKAFRELDHHEEADMRDWDAAMTGDFWCTDNFFCKEG